MIDCRLLIVNLNRKLSQIELTSKELLKIYHLYKYIANFLEIPNVGFFLSLLPFL